MDLMQFHKMRTAIQGNASPGSFSDKASLGGTLRDLLMASGLFERVEVGNTDDYDRMVIALCDFRPDVTADDVAQRLEAIWHNRVRYPFWEAHAFHVDAGHVEFQAATRQGNGGHYVTVHVVAQKSEIPAQRVPID